MNTTDREIFLKDCIVVARMLQPALTGKELAKLAEEIVSKRFGTELAQKKDG